MPGRLGSSLQLGKKLTFLGPELFFLILAHPENKM